MSNNPANYFYGVVIRHKTTGKFVDSLTHAGSFQKAASPCQEAFALPRLYRDRATATRAISSHCIMLPQSSQQSGYETSSKPEDFEILEAFITVQKTSSCKPTQ